MLGKKDENVEVKLVMLFGDMNNFFEWEREG